MEKDISKVFLPTDLLKRYPRPIPVSKNIIKDIRRKLKSICIAHTINIEKIFIYSSPTVISAEIVVVGEYMTKNNNKKNLSNALIWMNLMREFKTACAQEFKDFGTVRLIDNYPTHRCIILEIPRPDRQLVSLIEMMNQDLFTYFTIHIPIALGMSTSNNKVTTTLEQCPNLLIAGEANTGKSILLHCLIVTMICFLTTKNLKIILIDTFTSEFDVYNQIGKQYLTTNDDNTPHVITSKTQAIEMIDSLYIELEERNNILKKTGLLNIEEYNAKIAAKQLSPTQDYQHWPKLVVVIKEYANLMMEFGKRFEMTLCDLAKKGSKVGIHLIIATKLISNDIITANIKATFPDRISFKVANAKESKLIIEEDGAQFLAKNGDMLRLHCKGVSRLQGCYISWQEIANICEWITEHKAVGYYRYYLPKTPDQKNDNISPIETANALAVKHFTCFHRSIRRERLATQATR